MSGIRLAAIDDIPDGGSAGYAVNSATGKRFYMAVRRGEDVFVYVNSCPHVGVPLDIRPGQFLNLDKTHIICANHGALFKIEDGYCVSGPCAGKSLTSVRIAIQAGEIVLIE